ncbi:MAG: hypothetical protein WBW16_01820 [Bacteroidota bacterium]
MICIDRKLQDLQSRLLEDGEEGDDRVHQYVRIKLQEGDWKEWPLQEISMDSKRGIVHQNEEIELRRIVDLVFFYRFYPKV